MTRVPTHRLSPAAGTTSSSDDNGWADAACLDHDPETWFPDSRGASGDAAQTAEAKAICAPCPRKAECLKGARERREVWGVWGGELFIAGVPVPRKQRRPAARRNEDGEAA